MFTLPWMRHVPERVRRTGLLSGGTALWLGAVALVLVLWAATPFAGDALSLRMLAMLAISGAGGFALANTRRAQGRGGARLGVGLGALAAALMGPGLA